MKALSIRQPWAWAILNADKDIENRDWRTNFRGRIAVHAAKTMTRDDYDAFDLFVRGEDRTKNAWMNLPAAADLVRGAIIGTVEVVDCVTVHSSPWFTGYFGFVLRDPFPLPEPIPITGFLSLWPVPTDWTINICERCGRSRDGHSLAPMMHEAGACKEFVGEFLS